MKKTKTNTIISKIINNNKNNYKKKDSNKKINNVIVSSNHNKNIDLSKVNTLNEYRNKIQKKFNLKNEKKNAITIKEYFFNENLNINDVSKDMEKPKKIYLFLKDKNKSKKIIITSINNHTSKKSIKKEISYFHNKNNNINFFNELNGNMDLFISNYTSRNKLNKRKKEENNGNICNNGGDKLIKQKNGNEIKLLFSNINQTKNFKNYNNMNINTIYSFRRNNNRISSIIINKKINNHRNRNKFNELNKNEDIHFNSKLKKNRYLYLDNDNYLSEYPENGGITHNNSSYELLKKTNNNNDNKIKHRNNLDNLKYKNISSKTFKNIINEKEKYLLKMKTDNNFRKTFIEIQKKCVPNVTPIKKLNMVLNQKQLYGIQTEKIFSLTSRNSSRSKHSYNENLEQKKKLLGINLKYSDYKIIKRKMEENFSTKSIKNSLRNLNIKSKIEEDNKVIKIIDKKNNKIKLIKKRSLFNERNKRNLDNLYENELNKKYETIDINKTKKNYINKYLGLNKK